MASVEQQSRLLSQPNRVFSNWQSRCSRGQKALAENARATAEVSSHTWLMRSDIGQIHMPAMHRHPSSVARAFVVRCASSSEILLFHNRIVTVSVLLYIFASSFILRRPRLCTSCARSGSTRSFLQPSPYKSLANPACLCLPRSA